MSLRVCGFRVGHGTAYNAEPQHISYLTALKLTLPGRRIRPALPDATVSRHQRQIRALR
jgi:hypothetical protein